MKRVLTLVALSLVSAGIISFPRSLLFPPPVKKVPEITKIATTTATTASEEAVVKRVIDGDTIELSTGQKVRYIGIDTPELVHPKKPVECFAKEAKIENQKLVEGKTVRLEKDVSETDKYGRILRYVYIGDTFINDYLVRQGFAHASTYPPDVRHSGQFVAGEKEAREARRGLWLGCPAVDRRK